MAVGTATSPTQSTPVDLAALLRTDASQLDADGCLATLKTVQLVRGQLAGLEARVSTRADELSAAGQGSPAADAHARSQRVSGAEARRRERRARVLNDTPQLADALEQGAVTEEHADALASACAKAPVEVREKVLDRQRQLTDQATKLSPEQFRKYCDRQVRNAVVDEVGMLEVLDEVEVLDEAGMVEVLDVDEVDDGGTLDVLDEVEVDEVDEVDDGGIDDVDDVDDVDDGGTLDVVDEVDDGGTLDEVDVLEVDVLEVDDVDEVDEVVWIAQVDRVMVLVSSVTAPFRARSLPCTVAPVVAVIDVSARMVPTKAVLVPNVAELPTCQKTLQAWAPLMSRTSLSDAVMSVEPA